MEILQYCTINENFAVTRGRADGLALLVQGYLQAKWFTGLDPAYTFEWNLKAHYVNS